MATEAKFHHQNATSVSVSEMLDHGSISFGRFAAESLAWEKWSVFSHNRCQEELEKFKAPGFVAQKKAFFEEYYKKLRKMKGLQAEHQEELKGQTTHVEAGNDASLLKEEKKFNNIAPIQILENDASSADSVASLEGIEEKQETYAKEVLSNLCGKKATMASLCPTKPDQLTKHTPKASNSRITKSGEIVISNNVKNIANKLETQGDVASSENISKIGSRSKKDGVKSSEKTKPSPHDKISVKAHSSSVVLGHISTLKVANGNKSNHVSSHRKTAESILGSTVELTSMPRNALVSSSLSGKTGQVKTRSNHRDSTDKFRRIPNSLQSSQCFIKETSSGGSKQKCTDRPKNSTLRNTLNLRSGVGFSQKSCDEEKKQEEVENKSAATIRKVSMSATITQSSNQKNLKLVQKTFQKTTLQPTNLAQARKVETRPKTPSWR